MVQLRQKLIVIFGEGKVAAVAIEQCERRGIVRGVERRRGLLRQSS